MGCHPEFFASVLFVFAGVAYATDQVRVSVNQDDNQQPVPRAEIRILGPGATNSLTAGDDGVLTLNAPPYVEGAPYTFVVTGWVVIDPCTLERGRTVFPNPAYEPVVSIKVLRIGDRRLKGTAVRCLLVESAADFGSQMGPSSRRPAKRERSSIERIERRTSFSPAFGFLQAEDSPDSRQKQWEAYLDRQAKELSLPSAELKDAIEKWVESANNPYDKGLAALYRGSYGEAGRLFTEAIESPEWKAKGNLENKLICRARAEHEQAHYTDAESDLERLSAIDKRNHTVARDLEILRKKKQSPAVQRIGPPAPPPPPNPNVKANVVEQVRPSIPSTNIAPAGPAAGIPPAANKETQAVPIGSPQPKLEIEKETSQVERRTGLAEAPGIRTHPQAQQIAVESPKKHSSKKKPAAEMETEHKKNTEHEKKAAHKKKTAHKEE